MECSVHDIAAAVIERHHPIDQIKLQKIVYFAAGQYMALTASAMFPEPIEAWAYGPVIYDLYDTYRDFEGKRTIVEPEAGDSSKLNDLAMGCVEWALAKFGEIPSARLIDLGHLERPWRENYASGEPRTVIPDVEIIAWFRERASATEIDQAVLEALFASTV
jgi:uncharacterized phage-associated protein